MPDRTTVQLWVTDDREGFSRKYVRAREAQAIRWAEEIIEISDEAEQDWVVDENGHTRVVHEHVQRSRLRVDSRKWMLARVLPHIYGDKLELRGDSANPVEIAVTRKVVKTTAEKKPTNRVTAKKNGARR